MKIFYSSNSCASHQRSWAEIKLSIPELEIVKDPREADVILAYLCAMSTEEINESRAQMKVFAEIKRQRPEVKLIAGGCAIEVNDFKTEFPEIDAVYSKLTMTEDVLKSLGVTKNTSLPAVEVYAGGTAAIPISTGCLRHCAFCKTAYLDMALKSTPEEQILAEIDDAVNRQGARHINITGENTSEWGIDLFGEPRLLPLLQTILHKFPDIKTLDVCGIALDEMTPKLLKFLTKTSQIGVVQAEIQSFIPEVRKAMNLTKTAEEVKQIISVLADKKAIISNIMVGHPGETEKAFDEQLLYIRQKRLYMLDIDAFVSTPGTASSKMEQIPDAVKQARVTKMANVMLDLRMQKIDALLKVGKSSATLPAYVVGTYDKGSLLMLRGEPIVVKVSGKILPVGQSVQCHLRELIGVATLENNMIHFKGEV